MEKRPGLVHFLKKHYLAFCGTPGLVVMGDDSCLRRRGFESLRHILDGHDILTWICCKNCDQAEVLLFKNELSVAKIIFYTWPLKNLTVFWFILVLFYIVVNLTPLPTYWWANNSYNHCTLYLLMYKTTMILKVSYHTSCCALNNRNSHYWF